MKEEWKDIEGLGEYQVSNMGRIYSKVSNIIMKQNKDKDGYYTVCLKTKTYKVHRLVGKCFLENPNNLPMINHKDGVKDNNVVNNLEWCDASYNMKHSFKVLGRVVYNKGKNLSKETCNKISDSKKGKHILEKNPRARKVLCIETGVIYSCAREAEQILNLCKGCIAHCAKGYTKTSGGLHWKYLD